MTKSSLDLRSESFLCRHEIISFKKYSTFQVKFNDEKLSKLVLPSNLTKAMLSTEKQPVLTYYYLATYYTLTFK